MVTPLETKHISKSYGNERVLSDINLSLNSNETLSILGRSGCGKTTLLKVLGGLESPDGGTVFVNQTDIQTLQPQDRDVVYLYQEALLFPHLTVFENIAFGLRLRKIDEKKVSKRTHTMIRKLQLNGMADRMPDQLSGGQKQRVSFGRALITNPSVLLLDEPFGNLDAYTRSNMQELFKQIANDLTITAVFVTHNVKEAILMGDRIGSISEGGLTIYPSVEAFVESEKNGVQEEIEFWQSIDKNTN
ncbi:ABC transporter ATP-binding protein [Fodinibius halophilus]|uniref:ABC transporter ATP-binding protein n=1 Tax=Fodinibius halophilus TaxID=1736908 RepID=A0A6M1T419_9BACT|nr:ABC transporter ATP-binding protein [Fodinibius halophilus]NGP88817.1 ABC transporter ATP-binding protein [Fodinibius halophilus]